jgi:hypothetical protein
MVMKRMPPPRIPEADDQTTRVSPARRSPKAKAPRAAYALEDTTAKPSRKSTRRSANRMKAGDGKARTAQLASTAPSARAKKRRY